MLIIGAKGFAKEILQVCYKNNDLDNLKFYDDMNDEIVGEIYNKYKIIKTIDHAKKHFKSFDNRFTIGIGNPNLRKKLFDKFENIGGKVTSVISHNITTGDYDISIGEGANILDGVRISNSVKIGKLALIYYNSVITHDCVIGDYVEISPSVNILGRVTIGDYTHLGANSTILPDIKIGSNVKIGAGAVVTKDIPNNCTAIGVPAKIIKHG